ncbi:MAG TPA: MutS family DNA mismatch repair protein, partial [Anaerolineae bacterium]
DGEALPLHSADFVKSLAPSSDTRALRRALVASTVLAACTIVLFLMYVQGLAGAWWSLTWVLYIVLFVLQAGNVHELFSITYAAHTSLRRLSAIFKFLERWSYADTPHLRVLCGPFLDPAHRPSSLLRRLTGILAGASLQQNIFLWLPVNLLIPWDLFFALLLRHSQQELYEKLPAWMETWHELEALCSLANYAYLNPDTSLPILLESAAPAAPFSARAIGHPLIPDVTRVCNDVSMHAIGDLLLLTGSNMSGKSSFLRTLGVNLSLAYAGGAVCAAHLETRLFRLFTCIAVSDSVVDGISYFYAEVKRLKLLLDALETADELPSFFLIDEIFRATNNRERLIGSRSYVRALAGRNGVGVISTHDLELTRLESEIPQLSNFHFREHVQDNRLVFDYLLRPGPSPSTNALYIMRQEGLPVSME